jgi:hypothetical protein
MFHSASLAITGRGARQRRTEKAPPSGLNAVDDRGNEMVVATACAALSIETALRTNFRGSMTSLLSIRRYFLGGSEDYDRVLPNERDYFRPRKIHLS